MKVSIRILHEEELNALIQYETVNQTQASAERHLLGTYLL